MKNQTDLIVMIVAGVFTVGATIGMWLLKRDPVVLAAPTPVVTTPAQLPSGDVSFANALPGGGNSSSGMPGMGGRGGMGGGMPGMGGMGGMAGGMPPGVRGPGGGGAATGNKANLGKPSAMGG